jgi:hypothetical protein
MQVDLSSNTVDGRLQRRRVCELTSILTMGPTKTDTIIRRLYGLAEPSDAANALKQIAYHARRSGIPIKGRRGYYWIG